MVSFSRINEEVHMGVYKLMLNALLYFSQVSSMHCGLLAISQEALSVSCLSE